MELNAIQQGEDIIPKDDTFLGAKPASLEWEGIHRFDKELVEDKVLLDLSAYSLWDRAYSNIRRKDPGLVEEHEELLCKAEEKIDEYSSLNSGGSRECRATLETITKHSLAQINGKHTEFHIGDLKIILRSQNNAEMVQRFKDSFVGLTSQESLEASVIWAGVCLILLILVYSEVAE